MYIYTHTHIQSSLSLREKLLQENLLVTANQKSKIDTHTKKNKEMCPLQLGSNVALRLQSTESLRVGHD